MAFTTSDKMKMVIFQDEVNGVLTDLMARSHVDNVIYEEGGQQKALSTKLAEIIAALPPTSRPRTTRFTTRSWVSPRRTARPSTKLMTP